MKNKKLNVSIIGTILFGIIVWYFWPMQEQEVINKESVSQESTVIEEKLLLVKEVLNNPYAHPKRYEQVKRVQRFQDAMSAKFEYYGKVVDQHGNPVVGADVNAEWGYFPTIPNGHFGPNYKKLVLTTDSNGRFAIKKDEGMKIAIRSIEKVGYEIKGYKLYMFSDGGREMVKSFSDPAKPVIFHAWKKAEAEALIYAEKKLYLGFDGQLSTIDLQKRDSVQESKNSGDFKISITRLGTIGNPSDWSFSLEGVGGGVIESNDEFMNQAPEVGYQNRIVLSYKKEENGYVSRVDKKFFLKSRSGQVYARLEMQIRPFFNDREAAVIMKYWANPNGSRNLQFDPSMIMYPEG